MIAHLNGKLARVGDEEVVVECAGVGYRVTVAAASLARLPEAGEELLLPTHLIVREDSLTLYGFASETERALFEELLLVSGVGPKLAQNLVSAVTPAELIEAIVTGDESRLTSVSGVGKKLAQRIVVELADRMSKRGVAVGATVESTAAGEVVEALTGLGFTAAEARRAARTALKEAGEGAKLEDVIRIALRAVHG